MDYWIGVEEFQSEPGAQVHKRNYIQQGEDPSYVTDAMVEDFIVDVTATEHGWGFLVKALLRNGITFSETEEGRPGELTNTHLLCEQAMNRIRNRVSNNLNFVLAWARNGLRDAAPQRADEGGNMMAEGARPGQAAPDADGDGEGDSRARGIERDKEVAIVAEIRANARLKNAQAAEIEKGLAEP